MALPGKARQSVEAQAAAEALLMAAEKRGPLMHARIGVLRVLNAGKPDPQLTPRKKKARPVTIIRSQSQG
jgi:hypothetical protein